MTVKKITPVILIVLGVALGVMGFMQMGDSSSSLSVGDVEISATDESSRTQSYVLMGLGALGVIAGAGMMSKMK